LFNDLRLEVVVRFVNIGGIVDDHCLNFFYNAFNILTLPHFCACPNAGPGFPAVYVLVYLCSMIVG
jgi:hypothetical protein